MNATAGEIDEIGKSAWEYVDDGLGLLARALNAITHPMRFRVGEAPLLKVDVHAHLLTIAGSGAGKTVALVAPQLALWPNSVIVTDPKGELAAIAAEHRARSKEEDGLGQDVFIINPTSPFTATINPFDNIVANSEGFVTNCNRLWNALEETAGANNKDPFWSNNARDLGVGIIMEVAAGGYEGADRSLRTVKKLLSQSNADLTATLKKIAQAAYGNGASTTKVTGFIGMAEQTLSGVKAQALSYLGWLDDLALGRLMMPSSNQIDIHAFLRKPTSIFLVIPDDVLRSTPGLARCILTSLLRSIMDEGKKRVDAVLLRAEMIARAKKAGEAPKELPVVPDKIQPILALLDECATLKKFDVLLDMLAIGRSAGVRAWPIFQTHGQIREYYGENDYDNFMSSCAIKTYMLVSDNKGSREISEAVGKITITVPTASVTNQIGDSLPFLRWFTQWSSIGWNYAPQQRDLLMMQEARELNEDTVFIDKRGAAPILAGKCYYYARKDWVKAGVFKDNPCYGG